MTNKIVLSGTRPTGPLHLGNYFGAVENWTRLQKDYECFFFIADWHALTTGYEDTQHYRDNITQVIMDLYACGLTGESSRVFLQSSVKSHAELHLLLSMITPLSWLERCPTYKDQLNQMKEKDINTYGFLGYPCLQAADILIYQADYVPVGEDQLPHIELTREIARRFNHLYAPVFKEPQPLMTKTKLVPGSDGRKMSKSYHNTIHIKDEGNILLEKVRNMVTDPARIRRHDPGHPEVCTVYTFHGLFPSEQDGNIGEQCRKGTIGCTDCKKNLFRKMSETMDPIHARRRKIERDPDLVREIILQGNEAAVRRTEETISDVRKAMRIDWE